MRIQLTLLFLTRGVAEMSHFYLFVLEFSTAGQHCQVQNLFFLVEVSGRGTADFSRTKAALAESHTHCVGCGFWMSEFWFESKI